MTKKFVLELNYYDFQSRDYKVGQRDYKVGQGLQSGAVHTKQSSVCLLTKCCTKQSSVFQPNVEPNNRLSFNKVLYQTIVCLLSSNQLTSQRLLFGLCIVMKNYYSCEFIVRLIQTLPQNLQVNQLNVMLKQTKQTFKVKHFVKEIASGKYAKIKIP